jgi:hypothetical protein
MDDAGREEPVTKPRARWRGLALTWLLSFFVVAGCTLLDLAGRITAGTQEKKAIFGHLLLAAVVALLSWPSRWLLQIFPEPSPSSPVRFVRRLLLGTICGVLPSALLAALSVTSGGDASAPGMLAGAGLLLGIVAALVDTIERDAERRRERAQGDVDAA